jgi:hypothetical protein
MPLHINPISSRLTKGQVLKWILDTEELKKQQVGAIQFRGPQAIVEIPESSGSRLVRRLDGTSLMSRTVQVWFAAEREEGPVQDHFKQLSRWLEMEERAEVQQALEWQSSNKDHDSSTTLLHLVIRGEDTGLGGYTLLTLGRRNPMESLPATQLGVGTPIRLSEQSSPAGDARRGIITRLEKKELEVALHKPLSSDQDNPVLRVDRADDETAMQRAQAALSKSRHARGDRLSELRDVCLGLVEPQFQDTPQLDWRDSNLDDSQREAISHALSARDVAIIHGPPGTGKTTALVELIWQAVQRGGKVLACAPSNLGVDNLFERLLDCGTKAVRMGHVARVLPHLRDQTLQALVPAHRDVKRVKKLRMEAAQLFRQAGRSTRAGSDRESRRELRDEAKSLLDDARTAETGIVQEILNQAEVVCATNTGLNENLLAARRFDLVVIDEACQCAEPSCWIPLTRADRLVLAGDHCQLPPTIISQKAANQGFNLSLQERLVQLYGDNVSRLLRVQYRMHEHIMRHSSSEFYKNQLEAHTTVASHLLRDISGVTEDELTTAAVRFIDTSGSAFDEEKDPAGSSLMNPEEADLAVKKVQDLKNCGVSPKDIAIITPYNAQVQLLREKLDDDTVEVGSIDGFQGREKEAIIISLVRSNKLKEIGFLSDIRRMNVALTRARRKLIVIGDSATITTHPFYQRLLDHIDKIGAYYGVWDEV